MGHLRELGVLRRVDLCLLTASSPALSGTNSTSFSTLPLPLYIILRNLGRGGRRSPSVKEAGVEVRWSEALHRGGRRTVGASPRPLT